MSRGGLLILTYHAIDATGSVVSTSRSRFVATLDALHAAGYCPVDLGAWIDQGRPEVARGYALTFDDGLRSILTIADEVERRRIVPTVFLVTDRMGSDNDWPGQPRSIPRARLLTWSDAAALAGVGFRFAAHGRTHCRLDHCGDRGLEDELRGARDAIEERLEQPCRLLAYPYGVASGRVRQVARRHFEAAVGTRLDLAHAAQDPYRIARIETHYLRSDRVLDRLLSSRPEPWLRRRRLLRTLRRICAGVSVVGPRPPAFSDLQGDRSRRAPQGCESLSMTLSCVHQI